MIWKTYIFFLFSGVVYVDAFVTIYKKNNYIRTERYADILHNDVEVYESLILNGIITSESLRLMDRVFIPQSECNIVKLTILITSGLVVGVIVC
tara:strand:- start:962 stop:1243 length:282 start_codon:yes stop_codon:yes gene_type:complete